MKLSNTYKKIRENWYSWTISIVGSKEELDQIKYVTYQLHKSFPRTRIISKDVSKNFKKTLHGWGEFLLKAEAQMKNGDVKSADLWLDLGLVQTIDRKKKYTGEFSS